MKKTLALVLAIACLSFSATHYSFAGSRAAILVDSSGSDSCYQYFDLQPKQQKAIHKIIRSDQIGITRIFGMMAEQSLDNSTNDAYGAVRVLVEVDNGGELIAVQKIRFDQKNDELYNRFLGIISRDNFKSLKINHCFKILFEISFLKDIRSSEIRKE